MAGFSKFNSRPIHIRFQNQNTQSSHDRDGWRPAWRHSRESMGLLAMLPDFIKGIEARPQAAAG